MVVAATGSQPSLAAAMARTPEPVPRSVSGPVSFPASLQLEQQLQAEAGGRVGAGAEGAAGVDDEVDRALARLLPGGPQPEPLADQQRLVEVLPAVGPVVGHLGRDQLDQAVPAAASISPSSGSSPSPP